MPEHDVGEWYFAGGTTANSNPLYVSLLNPTSTPVVVDLSFMTPTGASTRSTTRASCCSPGQVQVENVASEVQNVSTVSTVVATRTGRVVASEVQVFSGSSAGLVARPGRGTPRVALDHPPEPGGGGRLLGDRRLQPGTAPESVTVRLRLASGPLAPLTDKVAPGTTWALATSAQTRIPDDATYSTAIDATGGPGVVVGRTVMLPASSGAPGRHGDGRGRPHHGVADRRVGGATARHEREPRRERRGARLPGAHNTSGATSATPSSP